MKIQKEIIKILSSCFYIGYSPVIPGTLATFVGFLTYIIFLKGSIFSHLILVFIFTSIGFYASGKAEILFARRDARQIVIDDLNGILVALLLLPYYSLKVALIGFIIFRIMDGLKPYPIYKIEKIKGSLGIMGDDLVAGLYTNIVLQIFLRFI